MLSSPTSFEPIVGVLKAADDLKHTRKTDRKHKIIAPHNLQRQNSQTAGLQCVVEITIFRKRFV